MRLFLFGQAHLHLGDTAIPLSSHQGLILAWLALHGTQGVPLPRVRLARAIWEDCDDELGRKRLANSLYRLKRDVPDIENYLDSETHTIGIKNLWVDVLVCLEGLKSQNSEQRAIAIDLYQSELLQEQDAPWLDSWRSELQRQYVNALQLNLKHHDESKSIEYLNRLLLLEPWNEDVNTQLIRLYAKHNRFVEALSVYERLKISLYEFSSQPAPELQAFVSDLEYRLTKDHKKSHYKLIGRTYEWQVLSSALTALQHQQGGLVLLEGEPGQGKTRLLREVQSLASWHKIQVAFGTAKQQGAVYNPLDTALQNLIGLLEQTTPLIRQTLMDLIEVKPNEHESPVQHGVVAAVLERWLRQLEQPLVWLFDDLQWASDLFWAVLPTFERLCKNRPILLVLTYRPTELLQVPKGRQTISQIRQHSSTQHLLLTGLSLDECQAFAQSRGKPCSPSQLSQLHQICQGNPLVFLELLLGDSQELGSSIERRFGQLEPSLQQALEAAVVLGKSLTLESWSAMLGSLPPLTPLLESRFIVREPELGFQHDLVQAHIYQTMPQERRRQWHNKAFTVLQKNDSRALLLAFHAHQAKLFAQSTHFYRRAAQESLDFAAYQESKALLEQAQQDAKQTKLDLVEKLYLEYIELTLRSIEGTQPLTLEEIQGLEQAAQQTSSLDLVFLIMRRKIRILADLGNHQATLEFIQIFTAFADQTQDKNKQVAAYNLSATTLARVFNDPNFALELAQKAHIYGQDPSVLPYLRFQSYAALLNAHIRTFNLQAAKTLLAETKILFEENFGLARNELQILNFEGALAMLQDDFEAALPIFRQQLELCYTMGRKQAITTTLANLSQTLLHLGNPQEALIWAEELAQLMPKTAKLEEQVWAVHYDTLPHIFVALKQIDSAEQSLAPIIAWLEIPSTTTHNALYAFQALGQIRLAQGRYLPHLEVLEAKIAHLGDRIESGLLVQAAEFSYLAGQGNKARIYFQKLKFTKNVFNQIALARLEYLLEKTPQQLERAYTQMLLYLCRIKSPEHRRNMLLNIREFAEIGRLWQEHHALQNLELPAEQEKKLVSIGWTPNAGIIEQQVLETKGKVAVRQQRIFRLMLEAKAQGAKPLQRHFADLLGVTLRTVQADMAELSKTYPDLFD
jgi:DNA-binding SARP family transcriptional activator